MFFKLLLKIDVLAVFLLMRTLSACGVTIVISDTLMSCSFMTGRASSQTYCTYLLTGKQS